MIVALLLMAVSTPVRPTIKTTEPETGSRVGVARELGGNAVARQEQALWVRRIGDCMIEKQRGVAMRVVSASNGGAIDYEKLGIPGSRLTSALSLKACMERTISRGGSFQWQTSDTVLRGTLVDALYRAEFPIAPRRAWSGVTVAPVYNAKSVVGDAAETAAGSFGECIVRGNFDAADRLIRSAAHTLEERTAFAAVMPFIGPCLQAGSKAALSKPVLRSVITDAAWRLANGTSAQAGAGTN